MIAISAETFIHNAGADPGFSWGLGGWGRQPLGIAANIHFLFKISQKLSGIKKVLDRIFCSLTPPPMLDTIKVIDKSGRHFVDNCK